MPRSVTCEGEAVILVPVLEAEIVEGRGVGELQVGKVPVDDLPVTGGQVHIRGCRACNNSLIKIFE